MPRPKRTGGLSISLYVLHRFLVPAVLLAISWTVPLAPAMAEGRPSVPSFAVSAGGSGTALSAARVEELRILLEDLFVDRSPSLPLSAVYNGMPPEKRAALLGRLKKLVLSSIPLDVIEHPENYDIPQQARPLLEQLYSFVNAVTPEQMDEFISKQDLDHLLPIPPPLLRAYHDYQESLPVPGGRLRRSDLLRHDAQSPAEWMEAVRRTDGYRSKSDPHMDRLVLTDDASAVPADEQPVDHFEPTPLSNDIVEASLLIDAPPQVLVNSTRLARALNHLTNPCYRDAPMKADVFGLETNVHDGVELYEAIMNTGRFDAVLVDGRMFVDFLGYWFRKGDRLMSIRIPTWVSTLVDPAAPDNASAVPNRPLIVPADHSEHVLVFLYKDSLEPAMLVRWYMGLPGGHDLAQGTRFKPAIWKRASWSDYRVVRTYTSRQAHEKFIRCGGEIMQLFNYVQWKYRFPLNGYNMLAVCQDTTALMEAILQEDGRKVTIWPLSRCPDLDFYYSAIAQDTGLVPHAGRLDVPSDARPDIYGWTLTRPTVLERIGVNIPTRNTADLHFPSLRQALESMADRSAAFRRALGARW